MNHAAATRCTPPASPNPWVPETVVLRGATQELDDVVTYHLAPLNAELAGTYRFLPGQFNMLYLPGAGEMAISISAAEQATATWAHTVRLAGNATRALARLRAGDTLGWRGPFGSAWPLPQCAGRDVLLVAGGIGLAPLRPAVYELLRRRDGYRSLRLLYGVRSPELLLYQREFDAWRQAGLEIDVTVDRAPAGWRGNVGVVTLLIEQLADLDPQHATALCCGPEVMMRFVSQTLLARGVSAADVWVSLERNMQCAVGFCGHCQLGPEFICREGPVLRYDRVAPWLKVEGL